MKILIQILLSIIIFTGCTQTNYNIQQYDSNNNDRESPPKNKKIKKELAKIKNEVILNKEITHSFAIIFPSYTIGKYALEATNSINTYLITKNKSFKLNVYDIVVQNKKNILKVIKKIKKDKITKVIAMITKKDLIYLNDIPNISKIKFYLPLINKFDVKNRDKLKNLDLTFGAISYKKQFQKLIEYAGSKELVEFYGNSAIGKTLHGYLKEENFFYRKKIDDNNGRYKFFLRNNKKLENSVVILNTPIIKSSILLSAINSQELTISSILSTQLNFTPLLFSLTQKHDRKKLIIANSIGDIPDELEEYNQLIGNQMSYSWVNYSTIVGVEYLLYDNIDMFKDLSIEGNQIIFPVKLYKVGNHSFKLLK